MKAIGNKYLKIFVQSSFILFASWLLLSCSAISPVEVEHDSDTPVEVTMQKFKFIPIELTIKAGQTVRWINKEKRQYHSVWFEQQGEEESDYLFPQDILDKKFAKPGIYPYRCGPHPEMIATIIVI